MRIAFIEGLMEAAERNDRVFLASGDIGFNVVEPFVEAFPDRFVNVGVAEQNLIGVATGLALSDRIVFVYSIANFPLLRCLEQIRNDVCYHEANVNIVAVGGGYAYGALGYSHHAVEDLSIIRSLPGIEVCAPGDTFEARRATIDLAARPGPSYLRLGRAGEATCHAAETSFEVGRLLPVREGESAAIVTTGGILQVALDAADELAAAGVNVSVTSCHSLRPLDSEGLAQLGRDSRTVVTIEEHSITGGLGSIVAEVFADKSVNSRLLRIALPPEASAVVGDQDHLRSLAGLTPEAIAKRVEDFIRG